ncbi:MAG: M48 family metalloprotease [Gammaproteobacteria bacterium]|nr:M48 family metalloprotease [Gammaproteobacteria bacterium]
MLNTTPLARFFVLCSLIALTSSASAGTGSRLYNELLDNDGFYEAGGWQGYVERIGTKLLRHTNAGNRKFYFFVVDSPAVNAFATPDAYIFVNRGLLIFLESEDQLAAVIAHEIGHVVAEHGKKQKGTELLGKVAGITAMLMTGRGEMMDVSNATAKTIIAGYGREMELEADQIGAEIVASAGYNPLAIIEALQVLKDQSLFAKEVRGQPATYHGLFATHPQNDKRLHDIVSFAIGSLPEDLIAPIDNFWGLMDGLKFGSEAMTGMLSQHVFFDKTARVVIEFPTSWYVRYNQQQVTGEAKGGADVAWAAITRHTPDGKIVPKDFVRDTLKRTELENEQNVDLGNGRPAYIAELKLADSNRFSLLAVVQLGADVYTVRGEVGPKGDEEQFQQDFMSILRGIRDMRPSDIQQDTTTKIKVIVAKPGQTYQELANMTPIRSNAVQTLRLLNGDYPRGEPRAGDYIKIIQ